MEPLSSRPAAFPASLLLLLLLLLVLPEARGDCNPPQRAIGSQQRQEQKDTYPVGTTLTFTCISGYEFISTTTRPTIQCLANSEWSRVPDFCQGKRCPIPDIENGRVVEDSEFRLGDQITFACDVGHRVIGQNGARCILRGSTVDWNNLPPHCQRIPCYPPPTITNGRHDGQRNFVYGTAVTYRCNDPFSLIGNKTLVCLSNSDENGMWSSPAPRCEMVRCSIPTIPNGVLATSYLPSYKYEDRVIFQCNPGYHLKGNKGDVSCGANSTWEPRLPECILGPPPTGPPTTRPPGGDEGTTEGPVGSTVNTVEETTRTEIAASTAKTLSGNDLESTVTPELPKDKPGSTVTPELPKDKPGGSGTPGAAIAGAVVGVIALVAIIALAYKFYTAQLKRERKPNTTAAPTESYTPVPSNATIPLEEKTGNKNA